MLQSLAIDQGPTADRTFCTWDRGWRSLLMRHYANRAWGGEVTIPPVPEQAIVLVTRGAIDIESGADGTWRGARYGPGSIGMTAPGRPTRLRWRCVSAGTHETLHLFLPAETTARLVEEVWDRDPARAGLPDALSTTDPVLEQTMLGLLRAAEDGAPDLYADSAAEFVAAHLLVRHGALPSPPSPPGEDERVRRARAFLRENLHRPLSLQEIAAEAGLSRYHFLRVFRRQTGETPHRYLLRLRVERGREELARGPASVGEIALRCGFASPAHFATAFHRQTGVSPSVFRRLHDPGRADAADAAT